MTAGRGWVWHCRLLDRVLTSTWTEGLRGAGDIALYVPQRLKPDYLAALLRCLVNSQDFDELGYFAQVVEGVAGGFVVAAEEVYVEDVFPGASAHGARLDLTQADVAQGEDAERFEERTGHVFYFEGNRSLIGVGRNQALVAGCGGSAFLFSGSVRSANQEEAGEVAFVVLDACLENLA